MIRIACFTTSEKDVVITLQCLNHEFEKMHDLFYVS